MFCQFQFCCKRHYCHFCPHILVVCCHWLSYSVTSSFSPLCDISEIKMTTQKHYFLKQKTQQYQICKKNIQKYDQKSVWGNPNILGALRNLRCTIFIPHNFIFLQSILIEVEKKKSKIYLRKIISQNYILDLFPTYSGWLSA